MASIEGRRGTAPAPPALPRRGGPVGLADPDQQRRDVRQRRPDPPQRRRLVRRHRHREEQGHQGVRARRPGGQHRPDRGADGHHPARRSSRRWAAACPDGRVKAVQTGGPSGGCIPARPPRHAGRLRVADEARLDHGLGRHDRHGRDDQHGRGGAVLHGVLHGRVVRQVHPVPRRHRADAPPARPDRQGRGHARRPDQARRAVRWCRRRACAAWGRRPPTPC